MKIRPRWSAVVFAFVVASALTAAACNFAEDASAPSKFAGRIDIGGGRKIYVECSGRGSPTVVLVSGQRGSAAEWTTSDARVTPPNAPPVLDGVGALTRVCAYDRPGTPVGDQLSRSDPAHQPTNANDGASDLASLLQATGERGPFVMVGHSTGGMIVRRYAVAHPESVAGLVLVDALAEGLEDAETPEQWSIQRILLQGDIAASLIEYPDIERFDADLSFAQLRAGPALRPMPLVVLSADAPIGPVVASMAANGTLQPGVPADFGYVIDAAQQSSQAKLAALVPGSRHVTDTHSGHDIHRERPQLVVDSIRDVLDAVHEGRTRLVP